MPSAWRKAFVACSETGVVPVDLSNETWTFGVNDVIDAMTH